MNNSTILVTGNLGYIGPVLAKYLKTKYPKITLIGIDNAYFQGALLNPFISYDHYYDKQIYGDLRTVDFDIIPPVDYIVSLAAISNDPMGNKYESITSDINYLSTIRLAKYAKSRSVKHFVFASSCSVYGAAGDEAKNEKSSLNPLTAYAKSKIKCEEELEKVSTHSFGATCLRFSTACGASPRLRLDLVLNDFVASSLSQSKIQILSDGSPWRPLINVKDMCRSIEWALLREKNDLNFLSINIGSNSWNYQIKDLAIAVQKTLANNTEVLINSNAEPDKRSYKVDFSLYEKMAPNFTPIETLETTIYELMKDLLNTQISNINFRESHLIRLRSLEKLRLLDMLSESLTWRAST